MVKFDFNTESERYDDYYTTSFGKKIDEVEKRLVSEFIKKIPEKEALEIGCGTGHWTMFFSDHGFQITAVDIADKMLQKAIEKDIPGAVFMNMNAEQLQFPGESVKNIFSIATAEFTVNKEQFFDEAFRVLKRGGYFLIGALNEESALGKSKNKDPVFKDAEFFTHESLYRYLTRFGHAEIKGCALISDESDILDYNVNHSLTQEQLNKDGACLVGFVKKS